MINMQNKSHNSFINMNEEKRIIMRRERASRIYKVMFDNYGFSPNYDMIMSLIVYRYCK